MGKIIGEKCFTEFLFGEKFVDAKKIDETFLGDKFAAIFFSAKNMFGEINVAEKVFGE